MPKTKRNKLISLTRVDKKVMSDKENIVEGLRECLDLYKSIYLFDIENMRNNKFKELRMKWKDDSRFFLGKNSLMQVALGKTPETEAKENLSKLTRMIAGECGLLFTNKKREEVSEFFENYGEEDFARGGFEPEESIVLPQGPLQGHFSHSQEPYLRKLGLPTELRDGVIHLSTDYKLCKLGQPITVEQAKILKLMGIKLSQFKIHLKAVWEDDNVTSLE